MLNEAQLHDLLHSSETHWVERKKSFDHSKVKETIVAFANSVPEDQHAVLFIGVGPDGTITHLEGADKTQRSAISRIAEDECFPPIRCTPTIIREDGGEIIAVVVEFSKERPHFAGAPFVRVGSKTIKDRQKLQALLDDLIASRNEKARRILRDKGKLVSVLWQRQENRRALAFAKPEPRVMYFGNFASHGDKEYRLEDCDAHCVHLLEITTSRYVSAPLEDVKISYDHEKNRTRLIINNQ